MKRNSQCCRASIFATQQPNQEIAHTANIAGMINVVTPFNTGVCSVGRTWPDLRTWAHTASALEQLASERALYQHLW